MNEKNKRFLIVDGNNLLYSSYYASQKLSWKIPRGAIFFFLRVIISLLKKNNYQKLLIVFDGGGANFRKNLLPQYKAQRTEMPEDLWEQMKELKMLLEKTNIACLQLIDWEADDLIASFISQNSHQYPNTIFDIFTRDKDLLQLINKNTNILKYINNKIVIYDYRQFFQEHNFPPSNYVDYLSLLGDKVDNIEGVKGIGPVSAKSLIQKFHVIENLYQFYSTSSPKVSSILFNKYSNSTLTELKSQIFYSKLTPNVPENFKKLLEGQAELALRNKKIISLEKNVPLPTAKFEKYDFNWESWKKDQQLREFCLLNRFNSILKLLG